MVARKLTHLGSSVNLGLPCVLTLTKHSGCYELVAILTTNKLRSAEKDGSPIVPWQGFPLCLCGEGSVDRARDGGLIGLMIGTQVSGMIGWYDLLR